MASASETVRGAQTLLKLTVNPRLIVDGIVGEHTLAVYNRARGAAKEVVDAFVERQGFQPSGLFAPLRRDITIAGPTGLGRPAASFEGVTTSVSSGSTATQDARRRTAMRTYDRTEASALVQRVRQMLPARVKAATDWVPVDRVVDKIMVESRGNPNAVSPSGLHHGLLQMGSPAWTDARSWDSSLPAFAVGRYDPVSNVRAAFAFWAKMIAGSRATSIPIRTWEQLYASHQQGAGGFRTIVRGNLSADAVRNARQRRTGTDLDGQSSESLAIVARAVEQARGARSA